MKTIQNNRTTPQKKKKKQEEKAPVYTEVPAVCVTFVNILFCCANCKCSPKAAESNKISKICW